MLHRANCKLVVFLLLPLVGEAARPESNRSQTKRCNVSSHSNVSSRDMHVSLDVKGSGVVTRHVDNAHDVQLRDGNYGICCLKAETTGSHDTLEYVHAIDKEEDSSLIPAGDKNMEKKMQECNLMALCNGDHCNNCPGVFNKTIEYHDLRKESLRSLQKQNRFAMDKLTAKHSEKIDEKKEKIQKLQRELAGLEEELEKKRQPFLVKDQELQNATSTTKHEKKQVLENEQDYKENMKQFQRDCQVPGTATDLGCCCELDGEMYVLKPAKSFAYARCTRTKVYTESVSFFYSCGLGKKYFVKSHFFHTCNKCK